MTTSADQKAARLHNARMMHTFRAVQRMSGVAAEKRARMNSAEAARRAAERNLTNNWAYASQNVSRYIHPTLPLQFRDEDFGVPVVEPHYTPDFWGEMEKADDIGALKTARKRKRSAEAALRRLQSLTTPAVTALVVSSKAKQGRAARRSRTRPRAVPARSRVPPRRRQARAGRARSRS